MRCVLDRTSYPLVAIPLGKTASAKFTFHHHMGADDQSARPFRHDGDHRVLPKLPRDSMLYQADIDAVVDFGSCPVFDLRLLPTSTLLPFEFKPGWRGRRQDHHRKSQRSPRKRSTVASQVLYSMMSILLLALESDAGVFSKHFDRACPTSQHHRDLRIVCAPRNHSPRKRPTVNQERRPQYPLQRYPGQNLDLR